VLAASGHEKERQGGEERERNGGDHDGTSLSEAAAWAGTSASSVRASIRLAISLYIAQFS
jgi:hypothetical protein